MCSRKNLGARSNALDCWYFQPFAQSMYSQRGEKSETETRLIGWMLDRNDLALGAGTCFAPGVLAYCWSPGTCSFLFDSYICCNQSGECTILQNGRPFCRMGLRTTILQNGSTILQNGFTTRFVLQIGHPFCRTGSGREYQSSERNHSAEWLIPFCRTDARSAEWAYIAASKVLKLPFCRMGSLRDYHSVERYINGSRRYSRGSIECVPGLSVNAQVSVILKALT
jgi:hypothetical protein